MSDSSKCILEHCTQKLGLISFQCRCGGNFCIKHRNPEAHSCDFDFKKSGRDALQKANCIVTHQKIVKI